MLHGEPGTGKSSLISAIISEFTFKVKDYHNNRCENCIVHTFMIDVATTSSDLTNFIDMIYSVINDMIESNPHATIYALIIMEEIDSVIFTSRENDLADGAMKQKVLLEFIDGIRTPNANCIFLATTNYYDNLDPALIRDGRFDVKIELSYFDQHQITEMCEHFGVDKKEVFEYNNCPSSYYDDNYKICPATLQNMILSYKIEKELEGTKNVNT